MTESTHTYSAVLLGSPDVPLYLYDDNPGSFSLDAGRAPHVSGTLTINPPGLATLTALTPTQSTPPRVQVTAAATFPTFSQSRVFNLTVRDWRVRQVDQRVVLKLASDEALLDDFRALADDTGPIAFQSSLRGLINDVLSKSITLRRNLALNPWPVNGGATADYGIRFGWARSFTGSEVVFTSQGGAQDSVGRGFDVRGNLDVAPGGSGDWVTIPVKAGDRIALGVRVKSNKALTMTAYVRLHDGASWLAAQVAGTPVALTAGVYARPVVGYTAPDDGYLVFSVRANAGVGLVDGDTISAQQLLIETNATIPGNYFDGGSAPTAGTKYDGAANASTSRWTAALAASPSTDFPVPALATSQNLVRNPRCGINSTDWNVTWSSGGITPTRYATGGPAYAQTYYGIQAGAGGAAGAYVYLPESTISVTPGKEYQLSVAVRAYGARKGAVDAILFDSSGNTVGYATPVEGTPAGSWIRIRTRFTARQSIVKVRPRVLAVGGLAGSEFMDVTAWRLSESTGDYAADGIYFDGGTADTAAYDFEWADAAHASISTREPLADAATPEGLTWKAGQTALDFLHPIVQRFGLRLVCDEARVWTLRDENYTAPGELSVRYGINMADGDISISRDGELWFDARVTRYKWTTEDGMQLERVDSFALNDPPSKVTYLEVGSAYVGPGRSEYAVRRAQGRGREVSVSLVSDWNTRAEQATTAVPDGFPSQTGISQSVTFDLSNDEMQVTLRAVDTPVGAIDSLSGTIDALVGNINGL